ncbi:MAG: DNA-directed RNA polymerase subunit beta' [Chloroflexi bacterium]|nr:MAG: DNA-directed RNA polymerase subunit beta' [Chloroflexota bacterium]HEY72050.1 DNA-directed RNA polymerase subunit beta' [Thermoflexia bacterium]
MEAHDFRALRISLASPERIHSWSYGEVTKPETINYRRLRPEKDGLFCEAIFGPSKDWRCYCGKYKNVRYKGIICDKCGVEVTRSSVRRERMGHIDLAAPVAHIWYTRRVPSYLGILLGVSKRAMDRVLYFAQYIITNVDEDARQKALKRLEGESLERQEQLEAVAQESITALEQRLVQEEARIGKAQEKIRAQSDEELAAATDRVMKDARSLQKKIEDRQGKTTRATLVFKPTGDIIAEKGATVGREHLALLNQIAQEHLNQLEADVRANQKDKMAPLEEDIERWRDATNEEIYRVQEQLAIDVAALRARLKTDRDELLGLAELQLLVEPRLRELKSRWGQVFKAAMGAEAFYDILCGLELDKLTKELWREVRYGTSKQRCKRATKRLRVVESFRASDNQPEWMILTVLPVIPPDLRPMVQLDGGRFATSDLNDLYRRVINRNNRLKRLLNLGAPDVIVRNEKRMLQEAVDSLVDNSQRGKALSRRGRRELKSLSDMLKGKKGRFRRNLLGKRVDYSGRSVIVIGPKLKLHQCGLPKTMALELYRPFVISKLVEYNYASNVKAARRIIERERPEVWEVLEEVIKDRPVLLNRAPTLHRLGIQAFEPILVEGKAIHIHPLVCSAFNADFDGDQMAVHLPLSQKAVEEARTLMLASHNVLKPSSGQPVIGPSKDMCLGAYYLTMEDPARASDERKLFVDIDEVELAYSLGYVGLHTPIIIAQIYDHKPPPDKPVETTVGRCIFNRVLPDELRFIDEPMNKSALGDLIGVCYRRLGSEMTTEVADRIKGIGFKYATRAGSTIAISDLVIPPEKATIIEETETQISEVERQYRRGLLTEDEQYARTIELWSRARESVSKAVARTLHPTSSVAIMAESGASKGGFGPIAQLAGMRGLMADPAGRIIPLPIRSNLREGLSTLEYFISTHGSRKGLADTALRTADAGYLTRRLVDVAQDIVINAHDCGTTGGIWIRAAEDVGGQSMFERTLGRIAAAPVAHPETGEVLVERNEEIDEDIATAIEKAGIDVFVRSPMTCQLGQGICAMCYGRDLGRGEIVGIGSAVGIVAAQSIGEPGTQLTLRTFHTGGVAVGGDITVGLPRIEELFEARKMPKGEAPISEIGGVVHITKTGGQRTVLVVDSEMERFEYEIKRGGWKILVEDGDDIKADDPVASWRDEKYVVAEEGGRIIREDRHITIVHERRDEREYDIPTTGRLLVEEGQRIEPGTQLIEGVMNPRHILAIMGRQATERYLLLEVQRVYRSQGVNINDKHLEVIFRKMLSKVHITGSGDTELLPGEMINRLQMEEINHEMIEAGGYPAKGQPILLGITKAALNTESFLSSASFQHTIRVLSGAAIEAKDDPLLGLKENVIIGKLIPAGTGYRGDASFSDGPIESFGGILLSPPVVEQMEEEGDEADVGTDVDTEANVGMEAEAEVNVDAEVADDVSSILGILAAV